MSEAWRESSRLGSTLCPTADDDMLLFEQSNCPWYGRSSRAEVPVKKDVGPTCALSGQASSKQVLRLDHLYKCSPACKCHTMSSWSMSTIFKYFRLWERKQLTLYRFEYSVWSRLSLNLQLIGLTRISLSHPRWLLLQLWAFATRLQAHPTANLQICLNLTGHMPW